MTTNEDKYLPSIDIEPPTLAKRSVIWLHGLGADGSDFVPIVPELRLPANMGVRFIFPHAPTMPVTINGGFEMRAWFDILSLTIHDGFDEPGITKSVVAINTLIEREISRGISSENIMLAGFSQGSAIAVAAGLCYPRKLGGIIALSGYLPLADEIIQKAAPENREIPIFIAHGTEDPVLQYALGKATYVTLKQAGYPVSWHSYNMPHSVSAEEVKDISDWMQTIWR